MKVDRTGTYKVVPIDWAVSKSRGGFQTFAVRVNFTEFYDNESDEWIPWLDYGVEETIYLCLVGKDNKTKQIVTTANCTQVMEVFGWNGESLQELENGDYSELVFQVRYKDNDPEYVDKNPYKSSWIDKEDANPASGLNKLDAKDLKALDSDWGMIRKASGATKKAVSAPKKGSKPALPPKTKPKAVVPPKTEAVVVEEETVPDTPEEKKAKLLEKSRKNLADRKPTVTAPPPRDTSKIKTDVKGTSCTKSEAWSTIVELKNDDVTDETLRDVFYGAVDEVCGAEDTDPKTVTGEQWFTVMHRTLDQVGKF